MISSCPYISLAIISIPLSIPKKFPNHPYDYLARTKPVLSNTPLKDGHKYLPYLIRIELYGKMYEGGFNFNDKQLGHTDVQRMRKGQMGEQFWCGFVDCKDAGDIDDSTICCKLQELRTKYSHLPWGCSRYSRVNWYCETSYWRQSVGLPLLRQSTLCSGELKVGRIATIIGIAGGHHVGSKKSLI